MELGTGLAILGSAIGGKNTVERILGPSADYLGLELRNWTEKRVANLRSIVNRAERKLGDRLAQPGVVPARVLKVLIDEGSFVDDKVMSEYYAGILASSRSESGRDDRGIWWSSLVGRLSSYQIRTHFIIYKTVHSAFKGEEFDFNSDNSCKSILFPETPFGVSMDFTDHEKAQYDSIITHIVLGLHSESLIKSYAHGDSQWLRKHLRGGPEIPKGEGGFWVKPSLLGIQLFMWVGGHGRISPDLFLEKDFYFDKDINISVKFSKLYGVDFF